jgi:hypothetical protein
MSSGIEDVHRVCWLWLGMVGSGANVCLVEGGKSS